MPFFLQEKLKKHPNQKGLSLVEVLMVIVAVGFIVILMANLPNAMGLITKSRHVSLAREIAAKQIEDKRAISYVNLVNDTQTVTDARMISLPQGSGTVKVEDCDAAICTNAEPLKQITVTVTWVDRNIQQSVSIKTLIGQGGLNQ